MSEMKRLSGSGKKPYAWKDTQPANRRRASAPVRQSVQPVRRAPVSRIKPKRKSFAEIWLPRAVLLELIAVLIISILTFSSSRADNSRLEALKRRQQDLTETIEASARTLEMESRSQVICQLAEERLYMVMPNESIALNIGQENQTAGR